MPDITDEDNEKSTVIDILYSTHIVDKTWRNITTTTVNFFKSCGFVLEAEEDDTLTLVIENTVTDNRKWAMITSCYGITEETFDIFVEIDEDVAVSGILADDDITDSIRGTEDIDNVEEESSEPAPRV